MQTQPAQMSWRSSTSSIVPTSSFMMPRAKDLTIFALQIARNGTWDVASHGIIHRDLAHKKCAFGNRFTCKICDFGLSRDIEGTDVYERKSKGATPYQGVSAMEVMRIVLQGQVLQRPLHCKEEMYELMTLCWSQMNERPMFADIVQHIEALMDDDYVVLTNYEEQEYSFLEQYTMDERV